MRIYKFVTYKVAPNATITYQSFSGWSVQVGHQHVGKIERMVPGGTMWAIQLDGKDYKIEYSFTAAKAALRRMLAQHYPAAA